MILTKQLNCKYLPSIQSLTFTVIGDAVKVELSLGSYDISRIIPVANVTKWSLMDCNINTDSLYNSDLPVPSLPYIHRSILTGLNTLQQTKDNGRLGAYALILEHGVERKYIAVGEADILRLKKKVQSLPNKFVIETWFPLDYWGRVISSSQDDIILKNRNRKKLSYQDNSKTPRR